MWLGIQGANETEYAKPWPAPCLFKDYMNARLFYEHTNMDTSFFFADGLDI